MSRMRVLSRPACTCRRRTLLKGLAGVGLGLPRLAAADTEATAAPRVDDRLVFGLGSRAGEPIGPADLEPGAEQVFAYPMDPTTGVIRNGSRLNQIIVVRLDPAELTAQTLARSVDGAVAYSGVCTHTGCDVTDWHAEACLFQCPCHESEFDPRDAAEVIGGPAPWPLAALALKLVGGKLAVAAEFDGRVGFMQQPGGLDPFGL